MKDDDDVLHPQQSFSIHDSIQEALSLTSVRAVNFDRRLSMQRKEEEHKMVVDNALRVDMF